MDCVYLFEIQHSDGSKTGQKWEIKNYVVKMLSRLNFQF